MKLQTYAKIMNNTSDFPWTSYCGNKQKGEKKALDNYLKKR